MKRGTCVAIVILVLVMAVFAFLAALAVERGADEAIDDDVRDTTSSANQQTRVYEQGEVCSLLSAQDEGLAPWMGVMDVTLDSCRLYDSLEDARGNENLGNVFCSGDEAGLQGKGVLTITLTLSNKSAVSVVNDNDANVIVGSFFTPYYLVETNDGTTEVPLRDLSFSGTPYDDDPMHAVDFALPIGASTTVTFGFLVDDSLDLSAIVLAPSSNGVHPYQFDLGL